MKKSTLLKSISFILFLALFQVGKVSAQLTLTVTITNASQCTAPCDGQAAANNIPTATYVWNTTPVQTTATATGLCPGTYSVTATIAALGSAGGSGTVSCANGVVEIGVSQFVSLFPNPTSDFVSFDLNPSVQGNFSLRVINLYGEIVEQEQVSVNGSLNKRIDVSALAKGVYFLEMKNAENIFVGKFLKQ